MRRLTLTMTCSLLAFMHPTARADVWSIVPRANVGARADQNLQLIPGSTASDAGGSTYAAVSMIHRSNTTKLDLEPQAEFVRYFHDHLLDRDLLQFSGSGAKYFETAEWDVLANYARDTTVVSERGTSGLTQGNQLHERVSIALSPSWQVTPKWSTNASLSWSNDRYPQNVNGGLVDYDYDSAVGQLTYAFTERTSGAVDVSFGELLVPATHQTTHQYAAHLHLDVALSERSKLSVSAGPVHVISDILTENGLGYFAQWTSQSELTAINVRAGRDVVPNGRGVLSKRDQALANLTHSWTQRWWSDLSLQWQRSVDIVPAFAIQLQDVRYSSVDASLRWQATPTISTALSVGWNRQEQAYVAGIANAYHALFSLQWQGLERTL